MAKTQKRGNREAKKPRAIKVAEAPAAVVTGSKNTPGSGGASKKK